MQLSRLLEAWIEANLLGSKTADQVMKGNSYNKGIRVHKITFQALWRLLPSQLLSFMGDNNPQLKDKVENKKYDEIEELEALLTSSEFKAVIEAFISSMKNPNTPDVYTCSEG